MYVWLLKFFTTIGTILSGIVFNFHKPIKNVKTKHNVKYKKHFRARNLFDIHYQKTCADKKPIILYFHGGGWCGYSKGIYSTLSRRLAKMGYVVFNVNYGLAPINKMQDIINDALAALKKARTICEEYGGDPNKIILGGDSAGAHIASLLAGKINSGEIDYPEVKGKIRGLLLFYGVYDLTTMQKSGFPNIRTYAKAVLVGKGKDIEENDKYSPIKYVNSSFPPSLVASGEIDKLHSSQSKAFYDELMKNSVTAKQVFFKKKELRAMHAYMIFDGLETNVITLKKVEEFLKEVTK